MKKLDYAFKFGFPEIVPVQLSFSALHIETKQDCDILLDMLDKDETQDETINSILDFRNSL